MGRASARRFGLQPDLPPRPAQRRFAAASACFDALSARAASFARLSDSELAGVITYTRNSWGNKTGEAIQPAEVKAARK